MLTLPPSVKLHVALRPIDMRAQFAGLTGAVRQYIGAAPSRCTEMGSTAGRQ